jgi:hypothetical protein
MRRDQTSCHRSGRRRGRRSFAVKLLLQDCSYDRPDLTESLRERSGRYRRFLLLPDVILELPESYRSFLSRRNDPRSTLRYDLSDLKFRELKCHDARKI